MESGSASVVPGTWLRSGQDGLQELLHSFLLGLRLRALWYLGVGFLVCYFLDAFD